MASRWPVDVPKRAKVAASPERAITVMVPAAISDRLDGLAQKVEIVSEVDGERVVERGTNRKELIAALIYDAPPNRQQLQAKLDKYRRAQVASAVLRSTTGDRVVLPGHKPGPRPTSATEGSD
jgi:hypothetical protein